MRPTRKKTSEPRPFRAQARAGEILAIEPQALEFSYLYTGLEQNDRTEDNIAIVRINGPLEHHRTCFWDSYEAIVERIEDAMTGNDIAKAQKLRALYGDDDDIEACEAIPASAVVL